MLKMRLFAAAIFVFSAASPSLVAADPNPNVTIDAVPSPVQVLSAMALPLNNHVQWAECVSFVNISTKLVTAVQFDFTLAGAFDEVLVHSTGDRTGVFSPGATIDGPGDVQTYNIGINGGSYNGAREKIHNCWTTYLTEGTPSKLHVGVAKVLFADGSVWSKGDPWRPAASPKP